MHTIDPPSMYAHDVLACPVAAAVQSFSGKWKPIMLHMLAQGELHFAQICRALPTASKKVLSEQLRELENDGIILRTPTTEKRRRVIYSLSPSGEKLAPVLLELYNWQKQHRPEQSAAAA